MPAKKRKHHSLTELAKLLGCDRKTLGILVITENVPHEVVGTSVVIDAVGLKRLRVVLDDYNAKVKSLRSQFAVAR